MILVAFWHGLRASEVTRFKADAVRDGHLIIQRLKSSLKTVQPLVEHPDPLLNERAPLIDFASKSKLNQSVFNVSRSHFWRLVQKYAKAAGIPKHKAHPDVPKHSIASTGAYLRVTDADAASSGDSAPRSAAGTRDRCPAKVARRYRIGRSGSLLRPIGASFWRDHKKSVNLDKPEN